MDIDMPTQPSQALEGSSKEDASVVDSDITDRSDQTTQLQDISQPEQQPLENGQESLQDWQSQSFQVFEHSFRSSSEEHHGIVKSFSTNSTFNCTVGESRTWMGIKDDHLRMTNGRENNFFKALKWSPDGSCLLSSSNDNCMRVFALPSATTAAPEDTQLNAGVLIKEGEVIYDMCWYPGMTSLDPSTCCILSSSRDHPVHLWDAFTGELRCSYTIVDHCEVNVAPNALCFNLDGSKIYCGSNNMIQIFDTARPGRDSLKRPTVPTRKSKKGQKGVISCLAFNPDQSDLYAAGSYLKTIGLYDARAEELLLLLRDKSHRPHHRQRGKKEKVTATDPGNEMQQDQPLPPPMGGLTQVQFTPDGLYLYSASRQDPFIRCWDIRNTAHVLHRLERPGEQTNQRISFDISSDGRWLTTGDMNGDISIFDLTNPDETEYIVSAAAFHPSGSMLATSSGQRKYTLDLHAVDSDSDSDSSCSSGNDAEMENAEVSENEKRDKTPEQTVVDNSINVWSLPGQYVWYVNGHRWTDTSTDVIDPSSEIATQDSNDEKGIDVQEGVPS
ncbi:Telomerase Cajal body protein 1 [Haplosporangium sp. Z 767]|nr:Telomerase Cajal body protein 1 [Haplosporangium sp. Z 767]